MNDSNSMLVESDASFSFFSRKYSHQKELNRCWSRGYCSSRVRSRTTSRRSWSILFGILQFAIIGVFIFPRPSIIILCNAWMITTTTTTSPFSSFFSLPTKPLVKRITTTATARGTAEIAKALWNTQTNDSDDGDDRYIDKAKIKSYSPFQASWKSTTVEEKEKGMEDVVDDTSSQEDPPELPIEEKKSDEAKATPKSNTFETPKMNINMPQMPSMPKISEMQLPDFPKMETPNMPTMNIPTMPNMSMPKMPEFPKVEAPTLPKFSGTKRMVVRNITKPSSSSANQTRLDEKTKTTTNIKGNTVDNKKNYSPLKASWKTTTTTTATITTTKTALTIHPPLHPPPTPTPTPTPTLTRKDNNDNNKSFRPKLTMPELFPQLDGALPKLPKFTARTSSSSDILSNKTKANTENNTDHHKDYTLFQASWKTTENTPTTTTTTADNNDNNSFRKLVAKIKPSSSRSAKNTNDIVDNKKNYSPYQASWKTTTTATANNNDNNINNSFPMIKLELPSLSLPDLRLLGLLPNYQNINNTNLFQIQKYNEEAQKLSITIDHNIKQKVNAFTGRSQYEVGDITKAIIAKVANEEFELAEITFFFRILIAVGADLSGFSAVLPVGGLVGLFGWSISMGLAERFTKVVSMEVNKRVLLKENNRGDVDFKSADPNAGTTTSSNASSSSSLPSSSSIISNSTNDVSPPSTSPSTLVYTPGDLTKRAVLDYTGKSSYATGDVAATMTTTTGNNGSNSNMEMNLNVLQELEECLSMEKALLEKLGRIQQQQPQQDVATTTP